MRAYKHRKERMMANIVMVKLPNQRELIQKINELGDKWIVLQGKDIYASSIGVREYVGLEL